jgi:hypothetical protein
MNLMPACRDCCEALSGIRIRVFFARLHAASIVGAEGPKVYHWRHGAPADPGGSGFTPARFGDTPPSN